MSTPRRLTVQNEDGSEKETEFGKLSREGWIELSKVGLCSPPPASPVISKNYIILRWKDGWTEVVGIDKDTPALLRYYTIERMEEVGRMSLDVTENYPSLFLVKRLPRQIESILLVGSGGIKRYLLEEKRTIKEGGKTEHILYDKGDRNRGEEHSENAATWVNDFKDSLRTVLEKMGFTAAKLLSLDETQKVQTYREISKALGIWGMEKQEDVCGFIQLMAENLLQEDASFG